MRRIWGVLGTLMFVTAAQGAVLWNEHIGQWIIGSYSDDTGKFSHCGAGYPTNGVLLLFTIGADYSWRMGLSNEKWQLKQGSQYSVRYWIDANEPESGMAEAQSAQTVTILLKDNTSLFNNFRRGNTLFLSAQSANFMFNLKDSSRALTYLLDCVKAGGRKPTVVATSPNPFGPPAGNTTRDKTALDNARLAAEQAEAAILAANLISELGITGFKILRPDEMPKGWKADAMWRSDSAVGTVMVLPLVSDAGQIPPVIIASDAAGCKEAFASGSLPAESSTAVRRLFTRCSTGKDALVGFYSIVPRRAGGHYVIGTFSLGEEDAAKTLDLGVRQAIFRALPK